MKIEVPVWLIILLSLLWVFKELAVLYKHRIYNKLIDSKDYELLKNILSTSKWNEK